MRLVATMLITAALLVPQAAPAVASAMPEAPNCPIYPDNNVWHSSIQNLPVHPMSSAWLANMGGSSRLLHPDFGGPYGYQLQVVDNSTPTRRVSFDYADESDDVAYPFTASTPIEPASDAHAFMLNKDTCVLYELFAASWNGGSPSAGSGAVFDLKSHALRPSSWTSADAAGLPIWPGVLRYDEVLRGVVDHAIRFTAQRTDRSFVWPARHQAGAVARCVAAADGRALPSARRLQLRRIQRAGAGGAARDAALRTHPRRQRIELVLPGKRGSLAGFADLSS